MIGIGPSLSSPTSESMTLLYEEKSRLSHWNGWTYDEEISMLPSACTCALAPMYPFTWFDASNTATTPPIAAPDCDEPPCDEGPPDVVWAPALVLLKSS